MTTTAWSLASNNFLMANKWQSVGMFLCQLNDHDSQASPTCWSYHYCCDGVLLPQTI